MEHPFRVTPKGGILTVVSVDRVVRSRPYYVFECSICSQDSELWPLGSIVACKYDLAKHVPCGCSSRPAYSIPQIAIRADRKARSQGYVFHGWVSEYRNNTTKCILSCPKHGEWRSCRLADLLAGKGCPPCAMESKKVKRALTLKYCEARIAENLKGKSWLYAGLVDEFIGGHSRVILVCVDHGCFESTFHYVNQGNYGCMRCAAGASGYDQTKPAYLYMLKSECDAYVKIGVSGSLPRRMRHLKCMTPFGFKLAGTWSSCGMEVLQQERRFHRQFESAGLSGFEGHSEWLKCTPELESEFLSL